MVIRQARQSLGAHVVQLLDDIENALLTTELDANVDYRIESIAHSARALRGVCAMLGLPGAVLLIDTASKLIDEVQSGRVVIGASLVVTLLSCCEQIGEQAAAVAAGQALAGDAELQTAALMSRLGQWIDGVGGATLASADVDTDMLVARLIADAGTDNVHHERAAEFVRLINELPDQGTRLGEILIRCGVVTERDLEEALAAQGAPALSQAGALIPPLGSILVGQGKVPAHVVAAALARQHMLDPV
jgi:hypothetical protein